MSTHTLYGKREIRAASYNRQAALFFLKLAEAQEDGEFYLSQASIVFSAFTHEAFLNTLGPKVVKDWKAHEFDSTKDKLKVIRKTLSFSPNMNKRPYAALHKLFWFRNLMAHGRDETMTVEQEIPAHISTVAALQAIESDWERFCNKANARRIFDDIGEVAAQLATRAGIKALAGFPFGLPVSGRYGRRSVT